MHNNNIIATTPQCIATSSSSLCLCDSPGKNELERIKTSFDLLFFNIIYSSLKTAFCVCLPLTDIRSLPDVAMTGNCNQECSELGHSDACWMPGQPSPVRKTRNPPKLSTFVPYQERGSLGRLANGSVRLGGEENRPRLPPSRSAYSSSDHTPSDHAPLEEVPLSVTSEFPPTSPPSNHASKREIYL